MFFLSKKYISLLESFDQFFTSLKRYQIHYQDHISLEMKKKLDIEGVLFCLWTGINYSELNTDKYTPGTILRDYFIGDGVFSRFKYIKDEPEFLHFQKTLSIDYKYLDSISHETISFLRSNIHNIESLREELINIFLRLTQYQVGSFVSLEDLLQKKSMELFYGPPYDFSYEFFKHDFKPAFEGILFSLLKMGVTFPAPYYYKLASFERTDELNEILKNLDSSFQQTSDKL